MQISKRCMKIVVKKLWNQELVHFFISVKKRLVYKLSRNVQVFISQPSTIMVKLTYIIFLAIILIKFLKTDFFIVNKLDIYILDAHRGHTVQFLFQTIVKLVNHYSVFQKK